MELKGKRTTVAEQKRASRFRLRLRMPRSRSPSAALPVRIIFMLAMTTLSDFGSGSFQMQRRELTASYHKFIIMGRIQDSGFTARRRNSAQLCLKHHLWDCGALQILIHKVVMLQCKTSLVFILISIANWERLEAGSSWSFYDTWV